MNQQILIAIMTICSAASIGAPKDNDEPNSMRTASDEKTIRAQTPSNYIEVIEENGNKRILQYHPDAASDRLRSGEFKVDAGSKLLIRVIPERLSSDIALANLLITAQLKHGTTTTNVEVNGYSVIGDNLSTGTSQNAVNMNSIRNVQAQMSDLFLKKSTKELISAEWFLRMLARVSAF